MAEKTYTATFAGKPLTIKVGKLAQQASGSVLVQYGETSVLAVATLGKPQPTKDYLPLTVDFEERYYAAGKTRIPVIVNVSSAVFIIVLAYVCNYMFNTIPFVQYFFESLLRIQGIPGSNILALPLAYSGDQGVMIAWQGFLEHEFGGKMVNEDIDVLPYERVDEIEVKWR